MTSAEIEKDCDTTEQYMGYWLREIAYQLAVMNERNAARDEADRDIKAGMEQGL